MYVGMGPYVVEKETNPSCIQGILLLDKPLGNQVYE